VAVDQKVWATVFRRILELSLFLVSAVLLATYVGGVGLGLIIGSTFVLWLMFNAYKVLPSHLRYLGALLVSTLNFVFVFNTVMPVIKSFQFLRHRIATTQQLVETELFPSRFIEVLHPWFVPLAFGVVTLAIWPLARVKRAEDTISELLVAPKSRVRFRMDQMIQNEDQRIIRYLSLVPLLAIAVLQYTNRLQSLAFTMSGDARNVFLLIMRSRLDLSFPSFTEMVNLGRFGEILAGGISIANGNLGYPNIGDQYAMRSVYLVALTLIVVSLSAIVISRSSELRKSSRIFRNCALLIVTIFLIINPYPISEILNSGFFSMFSSIGFLIATVSFICSPTQPRSDVIIFMVIGGALTCLSYQLFGLIVLPTILVLLCIHSWHRVQRWYFRVIGILFMSGVAIMVAKGWPVISEKFERKVNEIGSIQPTTNRFTLVVLLLAVLFLISMRTNLRHLSLKIIGLTGSSLLALQLIKGARGNSSDAYGYYGAKVIYASNFVSWFLVVSLVSTLLFTLTTKVEGKSTKGYVKVLTLLVPTTLMMAAVSGSIAGTLHFTHAPSPIRKVLNDWDAPSSQTVGKILDLWNEGESSFIFAQHSSEANDRIANFWSPYFWDVNMWQWIYAPYMIDAPRLCPPINGRAVLLVTSSGSLVRQFRSFCPLLTTSMRVKYLPEDIKPNDKPSRISPRENREFDFSQ
jgi:hypothetical protein